MPKERVKVVLDVHEPDLLMGKFMLHEDVENVIVPEGGLDSADFIIGGVGFERKTPSDFASSIMDEDRNVYDQAQRMTQTYENCYILLQGNPEDFENLEHSDIPPKSLRGAMASLTARYCPVIPTGGSWVEDQEGGEGVSQKSMELLVDMAMRIGRKHNEDASHHYMDTTSAGDNTPFITKMYACMEGIGPETAKALSEKFSTVDDAMEASVSDFEGVRGVGEKRAKQIHRTLHEKEESDSTERVIL